MQRGAGLFDQGADPRRFVGAEVVQHDPVPGAELGDQVARDPCAWAIRDKNA